MEPRELDELVQRAQRHDAEALDALVRAYGPRLYGLAYRMTGSAEAAEECLQETCLRLVRTIGRYAHDGRFEAWLFRIAANLARDYRRQARRRPVGGSDSLATRAAHGLATELRGSDGPWRALELREQDSHLQQALLKLPEIDREIVLLRYFGELSFQEIAGLLNIPLGTALARAHRALGKLRASYDST